MVQAMFDLTGRKALVTGASRGLGYGMAEALLEAGAEAVIVGSSDRVHSAANELAQSTGGKVHPIQTDLGKRDQLRQCFNDALEVLGTLDILVVCHGIQRRSPAEQFPLEQWDEVIEVNLSSVFMLDQLAGQIMLQKGKGKIINVASLLSFSGGITVPAYAAAKAGVSRLTMSFANEWAGRGINVNAIAPGYMDTDLNTALKSDTSRYQAITSRIPAGRWGTADDMKGITLLLASDASDYINGVTIPVDGGWMGR
ncbi:MAG: SDR family oxidoreductase [Anaerolineaceae bacterium]|nr:SDR family oxidoreductase [Anaerolineaceae bacterium]